MEIILPLVVQLIGGGSGGDMVGKMTENKSLGSKGNMIAGALGGLAGVFLAGQIPGLDGVLGDMINDGGFNPSALLAQGLTSVVGGGILTAIAGFVKNNMVKN